jgi:predicted ATP-binding protein involved in virulence
LKTSFGSLLKEGGTAPMPPPSLEKSPCKPAGHRIQMELHMRIDRLTVKNFKGFENKPFDFPRSIDSPTNGNGSFHLIIGQNGKGKTSALDALAVAAGSWFLGVRGEDSRHIQPEDIRVKVLQYGDTARIEQQLPVTVEAEGQVTGQRMTWTRELLGKKTNWIKAKNIKAAAEKAVELMQHGDAVTLPLISYYGTGRLWQEPRDMRELQGEEDSGREVKSPQELPQLAEDDLAKAFASRLAGYRFSIDPRCSPRDLLRWLKFEQQLALQEQHESQQFQAVKEAIRQAVEGCERVECHLRLGLLLDIAGQPRLPFGALSDGQRNMIAMVGDLAFKAAQLNPHLGSEVLVRTPGIVLIDELDLHLHPCWQRHVVEDLRRMFPEVQFIATTHSPFIVQSMRDGELLPLDAQSVPETGNLGVEEIARGLMGVKHPEVSRRYYEMVGKAKEYLMLLQEAAKSPDAKLAEFEERLASGIAPFADNPAFQAFLEMERAAAIGHRRERATDRNGGEIAGEGLGA